jgi:hypothetical protein
MSKAQRPAAKRQMMNLMQAGRPWQEAATMAGVHTSRSTAYHWFQQYRTREKPPCMMADRDMPPKSVNPCSNGLSPRVAKLPQTPSSAVQKELPERFGCIVSITHPMGAAMAEKQHPKSRSRYVLMSKRYTRKGY